MTTFPGHPDRDSASAKETKSMIPFGFNFGYRI
jgi:hypothetical protein